MLYFNIGPGVWLKPYLSDVNLDACFQYPTKTIIPRTPCPSRSVQTTVVVVGFLQSMVDVLEVGSMEYVHS